MVGAQVPGRRFTNRRRIRAHNRLHLDAHRGCLFLHHRVVSNACSGAPLCSIGLAKINHFLWCDAIVKVQANQGVVVHFWCAHYCPEHVSEVINLT